MTPIFPSVVNPFPNNRHDQVIFMAAILLHVEIISLNEQKIKYVCERGRSAYEFLVACAISDKYEPWGPHGSLLVASKILLFSCRKEE